MPCPPQGDDDVDLFRRAMRDVRPIKPDNRQHSNKKPPSATVPRPQSAAAIRTYSENTQAPLVDDCQGENAVFARGGIQKKTVRDLKRGDIRIDSTIDLHGLRRHEALDLLETFFDEAGRRDYRCVLVIHGKGYGSENRQGVLKPLTVGWLRESAQVLAFSSAQPRDGGTGAVYVLLAKPRS